MEPFSFQDAMLLAAIAFSGALIFGITGFGSALITIPLATHFVPLKFALALFALVDLACALSVGLENPRNAVRSECKRLVPMILVGTLLGATLLVSLPRRTGLLLLGLFVLFYSAYSFYNLTKKQSPKIIAPGWAWLAGLLGGISSTVFGAGGPPYVIYLSQRGLTKEQFRATLGLTIISSISVRIAAFLLTGLLLDPQVWTAALAAVPAALLAIYLSKKIYLKISREVLMRAVAVLLLFSGGSLILKAF
jgi:uncharacterized membrane protein YfcA